MADAHADPGAEAASPALPDLGRDRLIEVLETDASPLAQAVRLVVANARHAGQNYAAFGSAP